MVTVVYNSSGFTWTADTLLCAKTEDENLAEIVRLGLEYKPETSELGSKE